LVTIVGLAWAAQPRKENSRESSFRGTWKGTINDLPGVDLMISQVDKELSGSVIFYFQERADVKGPWKVTAPHAVPLLKPQIAGKILTFEVEHHVCHGCAELGPNARFRMELVSGNEARLTRLEEDGTEDGPQLKLVRSAQTPSQAAPPMQRGITVEMPATSNAASMPDADQESALIVAVTREGKLYLGVEPIDPEALSGELRDSSSAKGTGKALYIKADARASYGTVINVLDAATRAGFEKTVLLTNQDGSPQPGTVSPPKGFTMMTGGYVAGHRPRLSL
jgi:biopolymer transport protein ExbD/biopolymer transport protein TolR